jgi:hypothetical protein
MAQLVFLRLFFLPSSVNADRHVLHGLWPGNAIRHSTCGTLDEAPVPSRIISTRLGLDDSHETIVADIFGKLGWPMLKQQALELFPDDRNQIVPNPKSNFASPDY